MATQQPSGAKGFAADTVFGPPAGNGSDDSMGTRAMPTRAQSAVVGDGDLRPTPENYLQQNPTVPKYLKSDGRRAKRWERNALCRYIGTLGIYWGHKHRSWFMAISGIITMTCLMLSIPPLVATTSTPQLLYAFNWARVETHWQLIQPVDWTENVYMGLLGMANKTHRTQSYYVPYNTKYCREFLGSICNSCYTASILTIIFLSVSIISGVLGLILDVHRIFSYFDYNLSKSLALFLHLVIGFPCSLLAWILWIVMCVSPIPGSVVFNGYGKTGVGIWLAKSWGSGAWCALFMFILRLIPGILHLLVPTPSWANNKGIKAMRNRKAEENNVLDPFDDIANAMMRKPLEEQPAKDPAFAIPIRATQPANPIGPVPPTERVRKESDAASEASEVGHYGEMISRVADAVGDTVPVVPLTTPARPAAEDGEDEDSEDKSARPDPADMATTRKF